MHKVSDDSMNSNLFSSSSPPPPSHRHLYSSLLGRKDDYGAVVSLWNNTMKEELIKLLEE
ncbi:MAG: hypothetical protein COY75_06790 [Nitrospirae bacterium CG_4_10_14_0_8_um_filter_41_23]|nr:MAG: hypothetical protein COV68_11110 [Nitrospirae bacterium CG11_big_fil_rev_8_21_14_0_20_41_14]PIV44818.1 MAG: hypothetical protein COS27_00125 [Nitrospirae bacterium CG02_land_8_20_14_3_00_41_53]PIW86566.1 MAG: hypothetical protein COZ94_09685 [Nitrospirae bacterium CG_4_8_14_3_um_filter_41_47]PIY86689.1 MAG: hypothetical protein COY75_06790 [Nitrospirae bacterium CG_4_10_14_0_8_um_filter_41_23]PJA80605.1 MAG: hypothetical protein CO148_02595 [Nitrospirae bacterium CG_4_9_14_3_um_filter_4